MAVVDRVDPRAAAAAALSADRHGDLAAQADVVVLDVVVDERLAEGTPIEESWALVEEFVTTTAVLCSHGDVIPELVSRAQRRGMVVPGKSGCSKGSVWALRHWDDRTFATGLYTPVRV